MILRPKNNLFWVVVFALLAAAFFLKFYIPVLIENIYLSGKVGILNKILSSSETRPLGFYQGRLEEVFWGPFSVICFYSAFLLFSLRFLIDAKPKTFIISVFLFLLVAKFEILFYPPFGDTIGGPFTEASWLFRNNFDYLGLTRQESFIKGGPKIYIFSVYPAYLAILMKLFNGASVAWLIHHLIAFLCGAVAVTYFREILTKITDKKNALLTAVMLLSLPLFQSQVEAVNMEISMVAFSILAFYKLARKEFIWACVFSIIAAAIKGVAIITCGVVFVAGILSFLLGKEERFSLRPFIAAILSGLFVIGQWYGAFYVLNEKGQADMVGFMEGWYVIKSLKEFYI
ncbi:MAG: hypothetical protein HQL27_08390, partial [Candidatus Omnitrophica bacterium]|nr:hypothetical protein [Candidatus Omnitrophota bacterium]